MSFTNGAKAQNKANAILFDPGLVWVSHNTRIEQSGRFKRVFIQEIGADQLPLQWGERFVRCEGFFHFVCPRLEDA